jgi:xanthine dehydrogenase accessory factor
VKPAEAARHVIAALEGGEPVVEVVVVKSEHSGVPAGTRMLIWADRAEGELQSTSIGREVVRVARETLRSRRPLQADIESPAGAITVFAEPHHPPDELVIVGAGHIARPLCRVGAMLGFRVIVLDDRPGFATRERFPEAERLIRADFSDPFRGVALGTGTHLVLVTRGHKYDYDALLDVLKRGIELPYIGMVGSQRRIRAALEQLVKEGIPASRLANVHAPIGLDIEAETPEEIAVSIAAELIRVRRGGTGASLRDRARVVERWIDR